MTMTCKTQNYRRCVMFLIFCTAGKIYISYTKTQLFGILSGPFYTYIIDQCDCFAPFHQTDKTQVRSLCIIYRCTTDVSVMCVFTRQVRHECTTGKSLLDVFARLVRHRCKTDISVMYVFTRQVRHRCIAGVSDTDDCERLVRYNTGVQPVYLFCTPLQDS